MVCLVQAPGESSEEQGFTRWIDSTALFWAATRVAVMDSTRQQWFLVSDWRLIHRSGLPRTIGGGCVCRPPGLSGVMDGQAQTNRSILPGVCSPSCHEKEHIHSPGGIHIHILVYGEALSSLWRARLCIFRGNGYLL